MASCSFTPPPLFWKIAGEKERGENYKRVRVEILEVKGTRGQFNEFLESHNCN